MDKKLKFDTLIYRKLIQMSNTLEIEYSYSNESSDYEDESSDYEDESSIYEDESSIHEDEFYENQPINTKRIELNIAQSVICDYISAGFNVCDFGKIQIVVDLINKYGKIFVVYGGDHNRQLCIVSTIEGMSFTDNTIPSAFIEYSKGLYATRV
jgi:hypothetical protein